MSLHRDFLRYYGNSWIGFEDEGVIKPAYLADIRTGVGYQDNDFSDDARDHLRVSIFVMVAPNQQLVQQQCLLSDPRVHLEQEELGYTTYNDEFRWLTWKPLRCTAKGLCARRIDGFRDDQDIPHTTLWDIYESRRTKNATQRQFLFKDGEVHYKGREIGTYAEDGVVTLIPSFGYLRNTLLKHFHPNVEQVILEENVNA